MTSVISCPLWSSVYECHIVECAFTYPVNCDDICMCVVNKQFELLDFVFNSVFVDLKYNKISLTFIIILMHLYSASIQ